MPCELCVLEVEGNFPFILRISGRLAGATTVGILVPDPGYKDFGALQRRIGRHLALKRDVGIAAAWVLDPATCAAMMPDPPMASRLRLFGGRLSIGLPGGNGW